MQSYFVYTMSNKYNATIYVGVTNNLIRRVFEHKEKLIEGFTRTYNCDKLVWYEETKNIESAIKKEKQMKKWKREYKDNIIQSMNPEWSDLYDKLI